MKILHTSDWHLGLTTEGFSRREEQQRVLNEICEQADNRNIDIVLIAGDLLCGANIPAYADEMLANVLLRLAAGGKRAVVAVAGNNDTSERFIALKEFGLTQNIFILNNLGTDFDESLLCKTAAVKLVDHGRGFLEFDCDGERTVIAFMPYPGNFFESEKTKPNETFNQKTQRLFNLGASAFKEDKFNIALSHMFVPHGKEKKDFYHEFSEDCIPHKADYAALGHVHDAAEAGNKGQYSGSIIKILDHENTSKFVIVLTTANGKLISKEFVRLKEATKVVTISGESFEELRSKLIAEQGNCMAKVLIKQEKITAEQISQLKTEFSFIYSFMLIPKTKKAQINMLSKKIDDSMLLTKFYEATYAKKPAKEIEKLFLTALNGGTEDEAN